MSKTIISNSDDVIDSRDVIERVQELEEELEDHAEDTRFEEEFKKERKELAVLLTLQEEAEGYPADWKYGETLIRGSYFKTYAQELAKEIGAKPDDARWPATCIDWEKAADELRMDYTCAEFDGVDYWAR